MKCFGNSKKCFLQVWRFFLNCSRATKIHKSTQKILFMCQIKNFHILNFLFFFFFRKVLIAFMMILTFFLLLLQKDFYIFYVLNCEPFLCAFDHIYLPFWYIQYIYLYIHVNIFRFSSSEFCYQNFLHQLLTIYLHSSKNIRG